MSVLNVILSRFKEVSFSVIPVAIAVLLINFTVSPMPADTLIRFLIGAALVVLGLTLFLLGVDIGITPLGNLTGTSLAKSNKLWLVVISGLILGFFISIAEPGLLVLSGQVDSVTSGQISDIALLIVVSIGMAVMISVGFIRVFYNIPLYKLLLVSYLVIFGLALFSSREFLAIAFDASGATTGVLAVPFILALSVGISKLKKDTKASEKDSFGLVATASAGAILAVLILDMFSTLNEFRAFSEKDVSGPDSVFGPFIDILPGFLFESLVTILPLLFILLALQKLFFRLKKRELRKLLTGFLFAFLGLFLFLTGVNGGFMDVGSIIGMNLALLDNKAFIIIFGFVLGVVTIIAEPAVHVLTFQIEEVTSGYVRRKAVLTALALGVGIAVTLSVIRVLIPGMQLWHFLLPGYIICISLMFFIPKLFVGIAFDAGGVATGPVTATFILAFIQGAAQAFEGADLMADGFGMIAMVAMLPIITLELLGLIFEIKSNIKGDEDKSE